jgi:hypothetical protein
MRFLHAIVIVAVLFGSSLAQKNMTDVEFADLTGHVKSIVENGEWSFTDSTGNTVKKNEKVQEWQYDSKGNLTTYINWGAGDKEIYSFIDEFKTYKYEHFEVPGVFRGPIAGGAFNRSPKHAPDPRYTVKFEYTYGPKGRIAEETKYGNDGSLISRTVYQYDDKGRNIGFKSYFNDILRGVGGNYFDSKGNLILTVLENAGDRDTTYKNVRRISDHKYDRTGNWIERTETTTSTTGKTLKEIVIRRSRAIIYY